SVQSARAPELSLRSGPLPVMVLMDPRQRGMRLGKTFVELQGPGRRYLRFRQGVLGWQQAEDGHHVIGVRQPGVGERVTGISFDRLIEVSNGFVQSVCRSLVPEIATPRVCLIRGWIHLARQAKASLFSRGHLDSDLVGDRPSYLALQRQDVAQVALVILGPNVMITAGVDQMHRDSNALAHSGYCALDHGVHLQLPTDL